MRKAVWRRSIATIGAALALGLAFAAPAMSAETTHESATGGRAWLGVYTQSLTSELREGMSYKGQGVLVNRVVEDSPADRAGVKKGDVITSFNSRSVDSPDGLADLVGQGKDGQSVALRVVRDGQARTLTAKLAARDDDDDMGMSGEGPHEIRIKDFDSDLPHDMEMNMPGVMRWMGRGRLGVRVETLNPDLGGYFSVPDGKGVLVVEVMKDTPAEKAGLKAGDVITRVGDRPVSDAGELTRALGDDQGKVTLGIVRKGARRTLDAELEKAQDRVIRIRRGDGTMRLNDDRMRGGMVPQRDLDELRRQIEELRRQVERLQKN
jgi:serine protease Do